MFMIIAESSTQTQPIPAAVIGGVTGGGLALIIIGIIGGFLFKRRQTVGKGVYVFMHVL